MRGITPRRLTTALAALLAAAAVSVSPAAFAAQSFTDVPDGAWYEANVRWAVEQRIVSGYGDGTFRPDARLTEAEFLAMMLRAAGENVRKAGVAEPWYAPYYEKAEELGYPVSLAPPTAPISRGQAAALIAASFGKRLSVTDAVIFVLETKISNGRTASTVEGYAPDAFMTRAEAVVFVRRVDAHRTALAEAEGKPGDGRPASNPPPASGAPTGSVGGHLGGGTVGGGNGGNNGGSNGGDNGGNNGGGAVRPDGPLRETNNEQGRSELLAASLATLGLTQATTTQGVVVNHPDSARGGSGAVLTKNAQDERIGFVQIFDDTNELVLDAAHALLQYGGVAMDQTSFERTIAQVRESGANGAVKIGNQLVTFVRNANPGQMTINFTLFE